MPELAKILLPFKLLFCAAGEGEPVGEGHLERLARAHPAVRCSGRGEAALQGPLSAAAMAGPADVGPVPVAAALRSAATTTEHWGCYVAAHACPRAAVCQHMPPAHLMVGPLVKIAPVPSFLNSLTVARTIGCLPGGPSTCALGEDPGGIRTAAAGTGHPGSQGSRAGTLWLHTRLGPPCRLPHLHWRVQQRERDVRWPAAPSLHAFRSGQVLQECTVRQHQKGGLSCCGSASKGQQGASQHCRCCHSSRSCCRPHGGPSPLLRRGRAQRKARERAVSMRGEREWLLAPSQLPAWPAAGSAQ